MHLIFCWRRGNFMLLAQKAHFWPSPGFRNLRHLIWYSDVSHNIQMSGPYTFPVGWNHWALLGNTTMKTYLERVSVITSDTNRTFFPFSCGCIISILDNDSRQGFIQALLTVQKTESANSFETQSSWNFILNHIRTNWLWVCIQNKLFFCVCVFFSVWSYYLTSRCKKTRG